MIGPNAIRPHDVSQDFHHFGLLAITSIYRFRNFTQAPTFVDVEVQIRPFAAFRGSSRDAWIRSVRRGTVETRELLGRQPIESLRSSSNHVKLPNSVPLLHIQVSHHCQGRSGLCWLEVWAHGDDYISDLTASPAATSRRSTTLYAVLRALKHSPLGLKTRCLVWQKKPE